MNDKITITMNRKQMQLMSEALEFHSRFCAGQLDHFPFALQEYFWKEGQGEFAFRDGRVWPLLAQLKRIMWNLDENASHGIGWDGIPAVNLGYEMYKMIEYFKVKERTDAGEKLDWTVHSSLPLHYSDEPLIEIKKAGEKNET